jgi:tRNA threonylcarbamoyladenosine biosynthesis protein TsaE
VDVELPTRRDTRALGSKLAARLRVGDVVFLEGKLGAGKTFLARAIARALGVPASEPVTSPTFTLVHELDGARAPIVHADLYRLTDASGIHELGLRESASRAIVLVEWGARFAGEIASDGLVVELAMRGEGRVASISGRGPRGAEILAAME